MRFFSIGVFGLLLLAISLLIAYIFNGAGTGDPWASLAGMVMTPPLVIFLGLPVLMFVVISFIRKQRH